MEYDIIGEDMDRSLQPGDRLLVRTVVLDDFSLDLVRSTDTATQVEWVDKLVDRLFLVVGVNSEHVDKEASDGANVITKDSDSCDMTGFVKTLIRTVREQQNLIVLHLDVDVHREGASNRSEKVDVQASLWPEGGEACDCEGIRHAVLSNLR